MTVEVQHTITDPESGPVSGAQVIVDVYPSGPGYVNTLDSTIVAPRKSKTDSAGLVSFDLVPNSLIVPSGTVYRVRDYPAKGIIRTHYIDVPDVAGPLWLGDLLVDPPGTLASAALSFHILDDTDVHAADLDLARRDEINLFDLAATFTDGVVLRDAGATLRAVGDSGPNNPTITPILTKGLLVDVPVSQAFIEILAGVMKFQSGQAATQIELAGIGGASAIGFFEAPPVTQPDVTGSRADPEQALASLIAALVALGLITDSTTP